MKPRLFPTILLIFSVWALLTGGCSDDDPAVVAAAAPAAVSPTPPSPPSGISALPGDGQVTVSWNAVTGASSYNLYWSTASGVTKTTGTQVSGATSPFDHTSLTNGTAYYYVVTAVNASGESAESAEFNATPAASGCGNEVGNGLEIISGPSMPSGADFDQTFRSLTVLPNDSGAIIMGTERNGFLKSADGGVTWTRHRSGLRHTSGVYPEVWDIAVFPGDPTILLAATLDSPGPVTGDYPSSIAGIYKSVDGGDTWSRMNCGLSNSRVNSVRFDASDSAIAVAGLEGGTASFSALAGQYFNGGMYRTTDGGANWSLVTLGSSDDKNGFWRIAARGGSPTTFVTFGANFDNLAENTGFFRSSDSGATWSALTGTALTNLLITSFDVSADGMVIYANERDSFAIRKSTDGGATWATISLSNANGPVAVSPSDANLVLYAGTETLSRSTDGLSSTPTTVLTAADTITDIVFAPSDPTIVYVIADGYNFYKSSDSGATFSSGKNLRTDVLNVIP
ncbi:MAG: hypothetical protein IIA14_11715 [SAR324 cluster bacterium]|nr:hypothetical protein [SAR324 cluster bacterium]